MQLTKLIMTWDIIPGQEQAYIDFNSRVFVPCLKEFGLQPMDSWYTIVGQAPQIMAGWVHEDPELVRRAVASAKWADLQEDLRHYVTNFDFKIAPVTGMFQL